MAVVATAKKRAIFRLDILRFKITKKYRPQINFKCENLSSFHENRIFEVRKEIPHLIIISVNDSLSLTNSLSPVNKGYE